MEDPLLEEILSRNVPRERRGRRLRLLRLCRSWCRGLVQAAGAGAVWRPGPGSPLSGVSRGGRAGAAPWTAPRLGTRLGLAIIYNIYPQLRVVLSILHLQSEESALTGHEDSGPSIPVAGQVEAVSAVTELTGQCGTQVHCIDMCR